MISAAESDPFIFYISVVECFLHRSQRILYVPENCERHASESPPEMRKDDKSNRSQARGAGFLFGGNVVMEAILGVCWPDPGVAQRRRGSSFSLGAVFHVL